MTTKKKIKEKYIKLSPVVCEGMDSAMRTDFVVGSQSFTITPYGCTKEQADWMGDMLAKALHTFLEENK